MIELRERPPHLLEQAGGVDNLRKQADMTESTCCAPECERQVRTRGMCNAHYQRFRRTGEIPTTPLRVHIRGRGCEVQDCDQPHHGWGYCKLHWKRLKEFGDVNRAKIMPRGERHWKWGAEDVGYKAVHRRIYTRRGNAADYACVTCDGPAAHWAYDHTDPDELVEDDSGLLYSADPERYQPMCPPCHQRFDRAYRKGLAS